MSEAPSPQESQTPQQKEFEAKRMQFFVQLGVKHKDLLAIHKKAGQISRDPQFGQDESGKDKRWGDPTQHCLVEAAGSQILGDMIGLSEADKEIFEKAAIVHDARKKGEIEETRAIKDLRGAVTAQETEDIYAKSKQFLLGEGVDPEIVSLTEAVAHTSLPEFAELDDQNNIVLKEDIPPLRLAMHYLDDVTNGTNFVNLNQRMDGLLERQHLYPYNEEGRTVWGGRTFFEAQREVGLLVENRLADMAGIADPSTIPSLIDAQLRQQINAVDLGAQAA